MTDTVTEKSAEQLADENALRAFVDEEIQAEQAAAAPVPVSEKSGPGLGAELAGYILIGANLLKPFYPHVAAVYTPDMAGLVGSALADVCNKYGWLQGGAGGEYKEEIGLLGVLAVALIPTYEAYRRDMAEKVKNAKKEPIQGESVRVDENPGPGPGFRGVQFGVPS